MQQHFKKVLAFLLTDIIAGFIALLLPKEKIIIYSGLSDTAFNFNPRLLYEYAVQKKIYKEHGYQHRFIMRDLTVDKIHRYPDVKFLDPENFFHALTIWRAKIWITASRPIYFNPVGLFRIKYINAWHGSPLKTIGLMDKLATPFQKIRFRYYGIFAYKIVAPSVYFAKIFAEAFGVKMHKILVSGSPVVEFLRDRTLRKNENFELDGNKKNILYAPTYRDYAEADQYLSLDTKFKKNLENILKEAVEFYYRPHPLTDLPDDSSATILSSELVEEISYNYNKFDLVITDYSSVGIDAMSGGIPVILYWADHDTYSRKRGFGVSKKVYEYAETATNPDQLIEKIVEKFKYQQPPFEGEPYHITEHKTCKNFFRQLEEALT